MSAEVLPGATVVGHDHGLELWTDPVRNIAGFWLAPSGATAALDVSGGGADAVELQWSALSAQVPSTRAVVLLDGPVSDDPTANFTFAHGVAEDVAGFVGVRTGVEAGPVEVLVFRPDTELGPWPEPAVSEAGAAFRFRHRGGAQIHLTLTIPINAGGD